MIDLHCHILPAIDDGPPNVEASVQMARAALKSGIETIVATPHVDLKYGVEVAEITDRVAVVRKALAREDLPLTVLPGAEIALTRLVALDDSELRLLCLGESSCTLVESPYSTTGGMIEDVLFELQVRGFRPLLAHPERCPEFQRDPARLVRLIERGVTCSVSAGSLAGQFGRTAQRTASRLVEEELLHNVSSDAHDPVVRPPVLRITARGANQLSDGRPLHRWLTISVPTAILTDAPLPPRPSRATSRGRRRRGVGR